MFSQHNNLKLQFFVFTGASEPKNMAYMNRLGLWGPGTAFRDFMEFLQSVEKRLVLYVYFPDLTSFF